MPDIIDITREVAKRIMGAEVILDVYEYVSDREIHPCPRVVVRVHRDDKVHQAYVSFDEQVWRQVVTAEFIGEWAEKEFEAILS